MVDRYYANSEVQILSEVLNVQKFRETSAKRFVRLLRIQLTIMKLRPPALKHDNNSRAKTTRPHVYDQVFITDNHDVYHLASKDTLFFRIFKLLHQFQIFRIALDGYGDVNPMWQTVLHTDEIFDDNLQIYVKDTLVIHCDSLYIYGQIIQRIWGPYTRLVLHGTVTVNQVKELINPKVQNIRINAKILMLETDCDDFAEFVAKQINSITSRPPPQYGPPPLS
uniref:Recep_L_domain domain-containing protein n=1 Tax=Panagrellus redivivus TaxID=6233 RepID=A0A7E4VWP5_PANRE